MPNKTSELQDTASQITKEVANVCPNIKQEFLGPYWKIQGSFELLLTCGCPVSECAIKIKENIFPKTVKEYASEYIWDKNIHPEEAFITSEVLWAHLEVVP